MGGGAVGWRVESCSVHWFSFEEIRLQAVNSNSAFHLNRYRLIATYSGNINESRIQWIKDRSSFGLVGFIDLESLTLYLW